MGWLASIAVGVVTAIATLLAAGYVANLAAGWYRVSSFEGASGYFVVGLALLGLVGGMIIGIVTARVVAAGAQPGFLRALAIALAVSLGTVGVIGGVARLGADVGPTSGGEALSLAVELRWPAGVELPPADSGEWFLRLGALSGHTTVFRRALVERLPAGRFDRMSFSGSRYYLLDENVLDSENLTLRPWSDGNLQNLIERIPPVGVAPDGQSFARLAWGESSEEPALAVTRLDGEPYRLPIDPARMRLAEVEQIDPAWVLHHFEWQRTPNGSDRLVERSNFTPLPWRGSLTIDHGYREYRVSPALSGLRLALIDFLVETMKAERVPAEEDAFSHEVRIDGATVNVSFSERDGHVGVWMDHGVDSRLVATIAQRFDAALATHRYDHLFAR